MGTSAYIHSPLRERSDSTAVARSMNGEDCLCLVHNFLSLSLSFLGKIASAQLSPGDVQMCLYHDAALAPYGHELNSLPSNADKLTFFTRRACSL